MKQSRQLWISRDRDSDLIRLWEYEPYPRPNETEAVWFDHELDPLTNITASQLSRIAGYGLASGECKQVRIIVEDVE